MCLGIPGSTAIVLPDRLSSLPGNTWVETVKVTVMAVAVTAAYATVHMVQHFMQP